MPAQRKQIRGKRIMRYKTSLNLTRETHSPRLLNQRYPDLRKRFSFKKRAIYVLSSAIFLISTLLFFASRLDFNWFLLFSCIGLFPASNSAAPDSEPFKPARRKNNFADSKLKDFVEYLGGTGSSVAAYIRVSTGKAAKEGFSMEVQYELINKVLKKKRKPSRIYWFFDPGKSGSHHFEKRKMNDILDLRKKGVISELWSYSIERMGREKRKLLDCYYEFVDSGGKIVTPEREYSKEDFSSEFQFYFEATMAQRTTELRTAAMIASVRKSFRAKHWNKSKTAPRGFIARARVIKEGWLKKVPEFDPIIKAASRLYARHRSIRKVYRILNNRFKKLLAQEPYVPTANE